MNNSPKISIIIPLYNGKLYAKESIESALNQTYDNYEIIIVNDGSNDEGASKRIAEKYARKFPDKVRYFEKENGGVSTALNFALTQMTGEYFSWLSHDDRYYPNKLSSQVEYLKDYDENTILYSDYDLMDENSNLFATSIKNHKELTEKKEYALLRGAINGITLLIPKKAFEDCGNFRLDLRCTQDYELWLRMMLNNYTFVHQPEVLATTRLHKNQVTNTNPRVITEGNELWNDIFESFPDEKKIEFEGSVYNYYLKGKEFMLTTPYEGTIEFLDSKLREFDEKFSEEIQNTLVSVIIPFYNRTDILPKTLDSVLNQTHKNFEIILVNDGTENIESLNKYLENPKIKLVDIGENKGVSNARNEGIKAANGKYIAFLDSDDLFTPEKIEHQLGIMLKTGSKFSYTDYISSSEDGDIPFNCDITDNLVENCIANCKIATPTVMVEKELLLKNNLSYRTDFSMAEDICFYLELIKYTKPYYIKEYLTIVTRCTESSTRSNEKQVEGIKTILKYALNQKEYYDYDRSFAYLACGLVQLLLADEAKIVPATYDAPPCSRSNASANRLLGILKRGFNALRKKGLIYCIKRFFAKLKNKLHF